MKVGLRLVLQVAVISLLLVQVFAPPVDKRETDDKTKGTPASGGGARTGGEKTGQPAIGSTQPTASPTQTNSTKCPGRNQTNCNLTATKDNEASDSLLGKLTKNKGMLQRAVYVLLGITAVVLVYFGLRTWRTRRRKSKTKKYGVITTPASDLEMTPLDQDDDDEDMTVFEVNGLHK